MKLTRPRSKQYSKEKFFCKIIKKQLRSSCRVSYFITETSIEIYISTKLSIEDILSKLDDATKKLIAMNFFEKIMNDCFYELV